MYRALLNCKKKVTSRRIRSSRLVSKYDFSSKYTRQYILLFQSLSTRYPVSENVLAAMFDTLGRNTILFDKSFLSFNHTGIGLL
jgi:hypothetical protein